MRFAPIVIGVIATLAVAAPFASQFLSPRRPDVVIGRDGWLFPGWERLADEAPDRTLAAVKLVGSVNARISAQGARLVVVLIPEKERVALGHVPESVRAHLAQSGAYDDLRRALVSQGVTVVDAKPVLMRLQAVGQAFQPRDAHWTGYAAEAVASQLAPAVLSLGALPGASGTGEALAPWTHVRRYADLVEIQRRDGVRSTPPDDFILRAYTAPAAGPFAVAVVGNSFGDRQYGLPQALSHELDRPVQHVVRYGAEGAWQAMADFLRAAPATRPKRVVWVLGEDCFTDRDALRAGTELLRPR